jgi:hypothetical protein
VYDVITMSREDYDPTSNFVLKRRFLGRDVRGQSIKGILKEARKIHGLDQVHIDVDELHGIRNIAVKSNALETLAASAPGDIGKLAASQLELSNNYYESVLKQARRSFIAAVVAATTGVIFFLIAVAIVEFRGGGNAATLSAIGGGLVETIAGLNFWLFGTTMAMASPALARLPEPWRLRGLLLDRP